MATKKNSGTDSGQKPTSGTRDQLVKDIVRIRKNFPTANITRNFYRKHGKFADAAIGEYFPTFREFVVAAGGNPEAPEVIKQTMPELLPEHVMQIDLEKVKNKREGTQKKYTEALNRIKQLETEQEVLLGLKRSNPQVMEIPYKEHTNTSEAVAVGVFSDWHIEEPVSKDDVGGVNEFSLEIARQRVEKAFQGFVRLIEIHSRDNKIDHAVIALLGDFITNRIHEDLAESNEEGPTDAMYIAQNWIIDGIKYVLKNLPKSIRFTVVCHGGNHGRMTPEQRQKTEPKVSFERFMYFNIRDQFKNEPRLSFQIANGYHTFLHLFEKDHPYIIRFHHGHAIKSSGGVGGIYPPVHKAIDNWNKSVHVNLDVFGHFHQFVDAQNFIVNGSLIGYNAFAVYIKAPFEVPKQAFFLVSKKYRSKAMVTPIFVE